MDSKIGKWEWVALYVIAALLYAGQLLLDFLFGLGEVANELIEIGLALLLGIYFHCRGVNMNNPKALFSLLGNFAGAEGTFEIWPGTLLTVLFTHLIVRADKKPEKLSSRVVLVAGSASKLAQKAESLKGVTAPLNVNGVRQPPIIQNPLNQNGIRSPQPTVGSANLAGTTTRNVMNDIKSNKPGTDYVKMGKRFSAGIERARGDVEHENHTSDEDGASARRDAAENMGVTQQRGVSGLNSRVPPRGVTRGNIQPPENSSTIGQNQGVNEASIAA